MCVSPTVIGTNGNILFDTVTSSKGISMVLQNNTFWFDSAGTYSVTFQVYSDVPPIEGVVYVKGSGGLYYPPWFGAYVPLASPIQVSCTTLIQVNDASTAVIWVEFTASGTPQSFGTLSPALGKTNTIVITKVG